MASSQMLFKVPLSQQVLKGRRSPRMAAEGENIRVYLRMRPLNDKERCDDGSQQGLKWTV